MARRGHSNIRGDSHGGLDIWTWPDGPAGVARVGIDGGASSATCRELPPLALRREEWEAIGRKMGWL
jgi:hypothetical protein